MLAGYVDAWNLTSVQLLIVLTVLYIVLGCFLDGVSMMVLTAAVVLPMVTTAGSDLIWFGIFFLMLPGLVIITAFAAIVLWPVEMMLRH